MLLYALIAGAVFILLWLCLSARNNLSRAERRLEAEEEQMRLAQNLLDRRQAAGEAAPEQAAALTELLQTEANFDKNSLVVLRIRRLGRLARTRLSGEQLLAEMLNRSEDLHPQKARFIGSILVFVALAGTVISLAVSMVALTQNAPAPSGAAGMDSAAAMQPFNAAVGDMAGAFFITFAGIVATLFVAFLNYQYNRRQDGFLTRMEEFSLDYLAPLLMGHPERARYDRMDSLQQNLVEATTKLTATVQTIGRDLDESIRKSNSEATALTQQFRAQLLEGANQFRVKIEDAGAAFAQSADRLATATGQASQAIQPALETAEKLSRVSGQAVSAIQDANAQMGGAIAALTGGVSQLPAHLQTLEAVCDRIREGIETFRNDQTGARDDLRQTLTTLQAISEGTGSLHTVLQVTYQEVEQTMRTVRLKFDGRETEFAETLKALRDAAQQSLTDMGVSQQRFAEAVGARFDATAVRYEAATRDAIGPLYQRLTETLADAAPAVTALERAASELERMTGVLQQSADARRLDAVARLLNELPETVAQAMNAGGAASEMRQAASAFSAAAVVFQENRQAGYYSPAPRNGGRHPDGKAAPRPLDVGEADDAAFLPDNATGMAPLPDAAPKAKRRLRDRLKFWRRK